jgi:hypothetical protein
MSMIRRACARRLWIAILVLSGVTLAACGSTSTQTATSTIATTASALRFSQCVRANGAPSFPDPGPGGYQRRGINLDSPAVQSAMNACAKYLPPSGDSPPTPESVRQEELADAKCMRANGVPSFPDPDANGNIQFPVGDPLPQSPAFLRAQNGPCKTYLGR